MPHICDTLSTFGENRETVVNDGHVEYAMIKQLERNSWKHRDADCYLMTVTVVDSTT